MSSMHYVSNKYQNGQTPASVMAKLEYLTCIQTDKKYMRLAKRVFVLLKHAPIDATIGSLIVQHDQVLAHLTKCLNCIYKDARSHNPADTLIRVEQITKEMTRTLMNRNLLAWCKATRPVCDADLEMTEMELYGTLFDSKEGEE